MSSTQRLARLAGVLYLIVGIGGGFAAYARATVHVPGDAAATAANVAARAGFVRLGIVADLTQVTAFLLLAMTLYVALRHAGKLVAQAMVVFVAVAVAMMSLDLATQYGALILATSERRDDVLVLLLFDLHSYGFLIAQIFFGLWLVPLAYLGYVSRTLPRALAVLLVVGCAGYLVDTFARFGAPELGAAVGPYVVVPAAVAEISMVLWLLVRGLPAPATVDEAVRV